MNLATLSSHFMLALNLVFWQFRYNFSDKHTEFSAVEGFQVIVVSLFALKVTFSFAHSPFKRKYVLFLSLEKTSVTGTVCLQGCLLDLISLIIWDYCK